MALEANNPMQMQSTNKATEPTFAHFKRLPQELQNCIWQCAIDNVSSRVVEIRRGMMKELPNGDCLWTNQFTSTGPIPSVLHACRSARRLAMNRWTLTFAFRAQCPKIFFDFQNDTLFLGGKFGSIALFTNDTVATDRTALRKIAFDLSAQWDYGYYNGSRSLAQKLHDNFPNITNLMFAELDVDPPDRDHLNRLLKQPSHSKHVIVIFLRATQIWNSDGFSSTRFQRAYEKNEWTLPRIRHVDYYRNPSDVLLTDDECRDTIPQREHVEEVGECLVDGSSDEEVRFPENDSCDICGRHHDGSDDDDDDSDSRHGEMEDFFTFGGLPYELYDEDEEIGEI